MHSLGAYLSGNGLEVGKTRKLTVHHYFLEPDQLYRLPLDFKELDFIFDFDLAGDSKFYPILLWEWQRALKIGGRLIIGNRVNKKLVGSFIAKSCFYLRDCLLTEKIKTSEGDFLIFEKKTNSTDCSKGITFGMLSNGKRNNIIDKFIESVFAENIPQFEIIVCGTYDGAYKNKITYIPFNELDNFGWITRKKNLICENAKFANIVVLHDRYRLTKGFYEGLVRFGFYYDVLLPCQFDSFGNRLEDWAVRVLDVIIYYRDLFKFRDESFMFGQLEARDWDEKIFINGPCVIIKKHVWNTFKWNERLFWNMKEDDCFSEELQSRGYIIRYNPFSALEVAVSRNNKPLTVGNIRKIKFSKYSRGNFSYLKFYNHKFFLPVMKRYLNRLFGKPLLEA